jgi:hypothetical protein
VLVEVKPTVVHNSLSFAYDSPSRLAGFTSLHAQPPSGIVDLGEVSPAGNNWVPKV